MAKWTFEPGHTAAEFCVRHMMVTYVRGHFKDVHGTLDFNLETPADSSVEITIDARKIWTMDKGGIVVGNTLEITIDAEAIFQAA